MQSIFGHTLRRFNKTSLKGPLILKASTTESCFATQVPSQSPGDFPHSDWHAADVGPPLLGNKTIFSSWWPSYTSVSRNCFSRWATHVFNTSLGMAETVGEQENLSEQAVPGTRVTVWNQHKTRQKYPVLRENLSADVVVVGAGLAGLSVAYHLAKAGQDVVVLEGRLRGSGQTGKTTGHLAQWNDDYWFKIEKLHGHERALQVAEAQQEAISLVGKIAEEEGFDCKFQRLGGYLFPHSSGKDALQRLNDEVDAVKRLNLAGCEEVDLGGGPDVGGITEALAFPDSANFQPLLYLEGLCEAITKHGGRIYENSLVRVAEGKEVTTKQGFKVTAPNIVLATNTPIHRNLLVHSRQMACRSFVVGLKIPEEGVKEGQYWSTDHPYTSFRTEKHEEHGLILVVGGNNIKAGTKPKNYPEDGYASLEASARSRWTSAGETVFRWTREVYEPVDQLHLYGKDPLNHFQMGGATFYVATGDSGQGTTGGTIGGVVISSEILGKPHRWSDTFSPSRVPPAGMKSAAGLAEYFSTTAASLSRLVLPELTLTSIEDLAPQEGAVLQAGISKFAVYKDESGQVRAFSPICPHLGCVVNWDPVDKTFDCPCHGSSFDNRGRCIQGPSTTDLTPVDIGFLGIRKQKASAALKVAAAVGACLGGGLCVRAVQKAHSKSR